jgi:hypothetical protein
MKVMSGVIDTANDDIKWYIYLCEKYNEEPVYDEHGIDPYSDHAYDLMDRLGMENIL